MQPGCIPAELCFEGLGPRRVVGRFDGGRLTTDGRVLLLQKVDWGFRLTEWLAGCFRDHRSVARIEHRQETLMAQRVLWLASGPARTVGPRRTRLTAPNRTAERAD